MDHQNHSDMSHLAAGQFKKEREYWLEKLSGEWEKSVLFYDFSKSGSPRRRMEEYKFVVDGELFSRLTWIINGSDARLHFILVTELALLLAKYTGRRDIVLGTPIYKQEQEGSFVNTVLPLRLDVPENATFKSMLYQSKQVMDEAVGHQNYPIKTLLYDLNVSVTEGEFPLFDIGVVLKNIQDENYLSPVEPAVVWVFDRHEDRLECTVKYNRSLYLNATWKRVVTHLEEMMKQSLFNVDVELKDLSVISSDERTLLLETFNNESLDYQKEAPLHEIFRLQAKRHPHRAAVVFEDHSVTYDYCDGLSDGLALRLRELGVKRDDVVGLMCHRSVEMIVGMLAVMKAGGAFLPLSLAYPGDRVRFVLEDSEAKALLAQSEFLKDVPASVACLPLDEDSLPPIPEEAPANRSGAEDLCYLIYTSGSTGAPKGVMMEHRRVVNLVAGLNERIYGKYPGVLNVCLVAPYEFDASVQQVAGALLQGHTLVVVPEKDRLDGFGLLDFYRRYSVDISDGTPTHQRMLMTALDAGEASLPVKHFLVAGEMFSKKLAEQFLGHFPSAPPAISNIYGPTEACVDSSAFEISAEKLPRYGTIPIGKPLPNERIYILDKTGALCPLGVVGELCIGGEGLARGYFKRDRLTAEKFIPDPFRDGERIYKTGDLARFLPDGNVEFYGRMDHQVKIRGLRIELGEIEARLLGHDAITHALVMDRNDADDLYLCAYLTADREIPAGEIKEYLNQSLPEYMVPNYYIFLDEFPLTVSGKVNRNALPAPDVMGFAGIAEYAAPQSDIQKKLVGLWAEVLGLPQEQIGIDHNFFEIGGHSLKSVMLIARIHKDLDVKLPLGELFSRPTVRELADYIGTCEKDKYAAIQPVASKEFYMVSPVQRRLYVLHQMEEGNTHYNMPVLARLTGDVDRERIQKAFEKLIQRHESVRTSYGLNLGEPVQFIHDSVDFSIEYSEQADVAVEELTGAFIRPYDLSRAPLFRVGLVKLGKERYLLMIDMHHIITDGVSNGILLSDFMAFYRGGELPPLPLQYKDYAEWQGTEEVRRLIQKQEQFWIEQFEGEIPQVNLPTDFPRPSVQSFAGRTVSFDLDEEVTEALRALALKESSTLYMLLLAIFNVWIAKLSAQEEIVVGLTTAGRGHPDLEQIVGVFLNTLALREILDLELAFNEYLQRVSAKVIELFENQDYQFEDLVSKIVKKRDPGRNALFDVTFGLWTQKGAPAGLMEIEIPGLKISPFMVDNNVSKFDMFLFGVENEEELGFSLEYCADLFKPETIERFIGYYREIISAVIADPRQKLKDIEVLSPEEKQKILSSIEVSDGDMDVDFDI
jgi:amino acid adenylation domain-containing protein